MGNGPTDDEAEIIQHDQLSQNLDEEPEVREDSLFSILCLSLSLSTSL